MALVARLTARFNAYYEERPRAFPCLPARVLPPLADNGQS